MGGALRIREALLVNDPARSTRVHSSTSLSVSSSPEIPRPSLRSRTRDRRECGGQISEGVRCPLDALHPCSPVLCVPLQVPVMSSRPSRRNGVSTHPTPEHETSLAQVAVSQGPDRRRLAPEPTPTP